MIDLSPMLVKKRFTFREHLHALKLLFPKGWIWNWPLNYEDILITEGIPSAESFGTPFLKFGQIVVPAGIASAETFGTAQLNQQLIASGIGTAEAFGTAAIDSGFYQFDDFESGSFQSGWDSEFTSGFLIRDQDSQKIAYQSAGSPDRLFPPSGQNINGDFEVTFQLVLGTQSGGNHSLWIAVYDTSNNEKFSLTFNPNELQTWEAGVKQAVQTGFTPPKTVTVRIKRESGTLYAYYNNDAAGGQGGTWVREDSWGTPGDGYAFAGDCYLKIDSDDGYGGYGEIEVKGDNIV